MNSEFAKEMRRVVKLVEKLEARQGEAEGQAKRKARAAGNVFSQVDEDLSSLEARMHRLEHILGDIAGVLVDGFGGKHPCRGPEDEDGDVH